MKQFLAAVLMIFSVVASAQDYNPEWEEVMLLENEGQIKSAATLVDAIYVRAKKDKNEPQLLKAFFFRSKYLQRLDDDAQVKIITSIQKEIAIAAIPTSAIMESLYAEMLQSVLNSNRYKISQRTPISGPAPQDFLQWGSKNFEDEIIAACRRSLSNWELLYKTPLTQYKEIVDFNPSLISVPRPLLDLLAERYINILHNQSETYWSVDNAAQLFGDAAAFSRYDVNKHKDETCLKLCQDIEKYYSEKKDTLNLQRAVLRRLNYVDKVYYYDKMQYQLATYLKLAEEWKSSPFADRAKIKAAGLLASDTNKKADPEAYNKALALYDEIIASQKAGDLASMARIFKKNILVQSVAIVTEADVVADKPFLAGIKFRNIDSIQFKIYRIPPAKAANAQQLNQLQHQKPFMVIRHKLPKITNHFQYSTEAILPALPSGHYAILVMPISQDTSISPISASYIQSSKIAFTHKAAKNDYIIHVANRETGEPVKGAIAELSGQKFKSDKNGVIKLPHGKELRNAIIIFGKDTLACQIYGRYTGIESENVRVTSQLYIDRPIYRPGQKVYFKGIVSIDKHGTISTLADTYIKVYLEDPNDDEVFALRLKTNEFGSVAGEFELPRNLTGSYTLYIDEDDHDDKKKDSPIYDTIGLRFEESGTEVHVEEYKRPTFEVVFDEVKDDIIVGKKSVITGHAKSFSGAPVQNARVKYSIKNRNSSWRDGDEPKDSILTGEIFTDDEGKFSIAAILIADDDEKPEDLPYYSYFVNVEVTDIMGETHIEEMQVNAGYHTMVLIPNTPYIAYTDKGVVKIGVKAQSLNGFEKPAVVNVKIYKLVPEKVYLKKRLWDIPEIQSIPEDEFREHFPWLAYKPEPAADDAPQELVFERTVNTADTKELTLDNAKQWEPSRYKVVYTSKDTAGNDLDAVGDFMLKSSSYPASDSGEPLKLQIINKDFAKDGHVLAQLSSELPQLYLNISAGVEGNVLYEKHLKFKSKTIIKIPVKNLRKLDIGIYVNYIWNNQHYSVSQDVRVRDEVKLKVSAETVTSKLTPGAGQTWAFTVEGQLPAEVLAGMYDASLDKFNTDGWDSLHRFNSVNDPFQVYDYFKRYTSAGSFSNYEYINFSPHEGDSFYTFGFNINNSSNIYLAAGLKTRLPAKGDVLITGTVSDASGPLPGASIVMRGTAEGVQTDLDGKYSIYVPKGSVLNFLYLGFKTQTITVSEPRVLDIILKEDSSMLANVQLDVYRRNPISRAPYVVATITSESIEERANADMLQSLQGQLAGINITGGSGSPGSDSTILLRGVGSIDGNVEPLIIVDGIPVSEEYFRKLNPNDMASATVLKGASAQAIYGNRGANGVVVIKTKQGEKEMQALQQVTARKNLNETAFFYPQLRTDDKGMIKFTFTTPEALTEWKLRLLAHNKKAESGYFENAFQTQKDLMVVPNMPRFLRERDTVVITAKIINLTAERKSGNAMLQLFDPADMKPVDAQMLIGEAVKPFSMDAKQNTVVSWKIAVPVGMQAVQYKIVAKSGNFADGEENILLVLTNRMLVTESLPLWIKPNTTKLYTFDNFKNNTSHTLKHHGIMLEYTSNTAWAALQSLPYLMEYEHDCSEQVFSRYYANAIASHIIKSNPKIEEVFEKWRKEGKPSKLEMNEELKSILLAETPWVLDNQTDEEQKNRLAFLFSLDQMRQSAQADFRKLEDRQEPSGGFPWFSGGDESYFITRHIVAGLGHLDKLGIKQEEKSDISYMTADAIKYLDAEFIDSYDQYVKSKNRIMLYNSENTLHYLYARSFHIEKYPLKDKAKTEASRYIVTLKDNWLQLSLYEKGMAALVLNRFGEAATAKKILVNLKETSAANQDYGMYWIENKPGWWWYRAPVETQALLIEAFTEIDGDNASADAMKAWLLKNKQNKSWPTTKATTEAVYALLMKGSDWLSIKDNTIITLGTTNTVAAKMAQAGKEAETGYIKLNWKGNEVTNDMAMLTVENKSALPGYGGFYWQYFEDLDRIKPAQQAIMNVAKELFVKKSAAGGEQLVRLKENETLKIGDLVTVRLVLNIKEDVEYVHLKDLRAAAFEPVDVISKYAYKDGLGFYRTTRDAATHFFFDNISRGTYVLEYDVRVNNAGEYSNGITTIQSMYAPEFSGHTAGRRVKTE